jgi:hypothetical protein
MAAFSPAPLLKFNTSNEWDAPQKFLVLLASPE